MDYLGVGWGGGEAQGTYYYFTLQLGTFVIFFVFDRNWGGGGVCWSLSQIIGGGGGGGGGGPGPLPTPMQCQDSAIALAVCLYRRAKKPSTLIISEKENS